VETNPIRVCELLVGPPDVNVLGVEDDDPVQPLQVHVEIRGSRPRCVGCGSEARVKDRPPVMLVDLPAFGRPVRLVWRKHRWQCPDPVCGVGSWTGEDARIGYARLALTDRAGRWVTQQVGRHGRTVNEVASELDCDWHTVNDAVIAYGTVLVDDPDRIGEVTALGLDETLFSREGPWNRQSWSTSIVDVTAGRLLDVVPGRTAVESSKWLEARGPEWRSNIVWPHWICPAHIGRPSTRCFPTPSRWPTRSMWSVSPTPNSTNAGVESRTRRSGTEAARTIRCNRIRRLLTKAYERLTIEGRTRLLGLLDAGDPRGDVKMAWHAKEVVRQIYAHTDPDLAVEFVERLGHDLQDDSCPLEVRSLGRTLIRWRHQIAAWHQAHVTNGPTEAANNLIKRVKRVAFGFRRFRNYRIRVLLYAGRPNWDLLATITPR